MKNDQMKREDLKQLYELLTEFMWDRDFTEREYDSLDCIRLKVEDEIENYEED